MTLHVVTQGTYSDYHIVAIYDNKEAAENHAHNIDEKYNEARVEEYELNKECKKIPSVVWGGYMDRDGNVEYPGKEAACDGEHLQFWMRDTLYDIDRSPVLSFTIAASTQEHANKIVNEKRAQLIASGFWDNPTGERVGAAKDGTGGHYNLMGKELSG
ncbi:hypothetical protein LCGC14_1453280 [marine sediment metagenome]|uniref:DUF7336 domain-containing protein n=1 Tax=marine sediment metagenome TaxID=412755 RepID=A0A0F9LXS5_9ZZZZ